MSLRIVSLFSGAGGLDLGFIEAGHEIVWANDIDADAVNTYRENIGDHIWLGDIKDLDVTKIPDCDMVIGGFPCQGFSVANTGRNLLDERNRLYKEYLRVVKAKQPKFFLAENVKGILSLGKGSVIKAIVKDFEDAGYKVQYRLLNAADYGAPQTRQRVLIVGVRSDVDYSFEYPVPTHSRNADNGRLPWVTVREAIGSLPDPDEPNNVPNHTYSKYKLLLNGYMGKRPTNPDKPAPTVTGRGDSRGGVVVLPHYNGRRRMTVRELATIQCFPEDFVFSGNQSTCYRLVANAVPPKLALAMAKQFPQEVDGCE